MKKSIKLFICSIFIFFFIIFTKNLKAACPSGADDQTVNILSGDSCAQRVSNPVSVTVAQGGSNILSNSNDTDGVIYNNFRTYSVLNRGTLQNTSTSGNVIWQTG